MTDCQTLEQQLIEARQALHDVSLNNTPAEIQTGSERTRWNPSRVADIRRQITELERQYEAGNCAVILGKVAAPRASRRPLRAPIGRR